ncbi:MAG: hypothetical protein HQL53_08040, partial [Magnetococcales bacterium]|nr:hypothetical protein [Magnetococcales bacterium]
SATAVKGTPEESRRVEVRMEFRAIGDEQAYQPVVDMPLGKCAIRLIDAKEPPDGVGAKQAAVRKREEAAKRDAAIQKAADTAARAAADKAAAKKARIDARKAAEKAAAQRAASRRSARKQAIIKKGLVSKPAGERIDKRRSGYGVRVVDDKVRVINEQVVNDSQKAAHKMQKLIQEQVRRNRTRQKSQEKRAE